MDEQPAIFESFLAACELHQFPGEWNTFQAHSDVVRLSTPAAQALAALRDKFEDQALADSGLVNRRDFSLELTPAIADGSPFIVLRTGRNEAPFDLLTAQGCVSGELPLFAVERDYCTQQSLESGNAHLLVTGDFEDLCLLRSLNFPVTLLTGLGQPNPTVLRRVFEKYADPPEFSELNFDDALSIPPAVFERMKSRRKLIFLASRICQLDEGPVDELNQIGSYWTRAAKTLLRSEPHAVVWHADEDDFERFAFARDLGDGKALAAAITYSLQDAYQFLASENAVAVQALADTPAVAVMQRLWTLEVAPTSDPRALSLARLEKFAAVDRELIAPLLNEAFNSVDPLRKNMLVMLAELTRTFQLMSQSTSELLRQESSELGPAAAAVARKQTTQLLSLAQHIVCVSREVRRADQSPTIAGRLL